jgi:tetratricopeptide (TPR) repeat protein
MRSGDYEVAESWLKEGLIVCRQAGDLRQITSALAGLGELAIRRAQYDHARKLLEESLAISQRSKEKWGLAIAKGSLGWIALLQRDFPGMRKFLRESLDVRLGTGDRSGMAWCLEKLAVGNHEQSRFHEAATTFGAASALRAPVGSAMDAVDVDYERNVLPRKAGQ